MSSRQWSYRCPEAGTGARVSAPSHALAFTRPHLCASQAYRRCEWYAALPSAATVQGCRARPTAGWSCAAPARAAALCRSVPAPCCSDLLPAGGRVLQQAQRTTVSGPTRRSCWPQEHLRPGTVSPEAAAALARALLSGCRDGMSRAERAGGRTRCGRRAPRATAARQRGCALAWRLLDAASDG